MTAVLRWASPVLTMTAGDGSWVPTVALFNQTAEPVDASGGMGATGRLRHPDGSPVLSRQEQPWPMPAVLKRYRLAAGESIELWVGLSLMNDEKAALAPGTYRLTEVRWGGLAATEIDVEISAG